MNNRIFNLDVSSVHKDAVTPENTPFVNYGNSRTDTAMIRVKIYRPKAINFQH
jgi:hypothetical protein